MAIRAGTCASAVLRKRMNSWCRWRCMLRPMTVPSSTSRAANSVVVAFVVVGHRPSSALLHRQTGLGAVDKLRVLRQFERPDTVRRELVSFQDALHRTQAHSGRLGKFPARPVGALARRRALRVAAS